MTITILVLMKKTALKQMLAATAFLAALMFVIDTSYANPVGGPSIWIESPQHKSCNSDDIELNFIVPPEPFWMESSFYKSFSYCLDGCSEVTIDGNTTLTGLSWGSHSLVVYAKIAEGVDSGGDVWSSQTVYFVMFPWFMMPIIIAAVVGLGWLLYFIIKNRQKRIPDESNSIRR